MNPVYDFYFHCYKKMSMVSVKPAWHSTKVCTAVFTPSWNGSKKPQGQSIHHERRQISYRSNKRLRSLLQNPVRAFCVQKTYIMLWHSPPPQQLCFIKPWECFLLLPSAATSTLLLTRCRIMLKKKKKTQNRRRNDQMNQKEKVFQRNKS